MIPIPVIVQLALTFIERIVVPLVTRKSNKFNAAKRAKLVRKLNSITAETNFAASALSEPFQPTSQRELNERIVADTNTLLEGHRITQARRAKWLEEGRE